MTYLCTLIVECYKTGRERGGERGREGEGGGPNIEGGAV